MRTCGHTRHAKIAQISLHKEKKKEVVGDLVKGSDNLICVVVFNSLFLLHNSNIFFLPTEHCTLEYTPF